MHSEAQRAHNSSQTTSSNRWNIIHLLCMLTQSNIITRSKQCITARATKQLCITQIPTPYTRLLRQHNYSRRAVCVVCMQMLQTSKQITTGRMQQKFQTGKVSHLKENRKRTSCQFIIRLYNMVISTINCIIVNIRQHHSGEFVFNS